MVKHELAASAYEQRRRECEEAARLLGVRALRDLTPADLGVGGRDAASPWLPLPEPVRSRAT